MHVQDVAFVIHQLNLHAFNVNRSKIDAFVGLQRRTKLNVGLSWLQIEGFHRNERENVGRRGSRVAVNRGVVSVLLNGVDGVNLCLCELARV